MEEIWHIIQKGDELFDICSLHSALNPKEALKNTFVAAWVVYGFSHEDALIMEADLYDDDDSPDDDVVQDNNTEPV